jgi:hypothetical protein
LILFRLYSRPSIFASGFFHPIVISIFYSRTMDFSLWSQAPFLPQPSEQPSLHPTMDNSTVTHDAEDDLLQLLRPHVEFNFSNETLVQDSCFLSFLTSNDHLGAEPAASPPKVREMDASHIAEEGDFVPAPAILSNPANPTVVGEPLKNSTGVQVSHDEHWIMSMLILDADRSVITSPTVSATSVGTPFEERVFVFEMPNDIDEQEILEAFTAPHVMPLFARPYMKHTWYVACAMELDVFFCY